MKFITVWKLAYFGYAIDCPFLYLELVVRTIAPG